MPRSGVFAGTTLHRFLKSYFEDREFHQLELPFACVAMDIQTGEAVLFRDGDVAVAVRASMNLPGVFTPVPYRQRYLVDGGVVDYIPVDAARMQGAQWVLASITESDYRSARPRTVLEMFEQVIDILRLSGSVRATRTPLIE